MYILRARATYWFFHAFLKQQRRVISTEMHHPHFSRNALLAFETTSSHFIEQEKLVAVIQNIVFTINPATKQYWSSASHLAILEKIRTWL